MYRRALLIAVLVCSTWVAVAAVQPGLAGGDSATTPTGSDETVDPSNDTNETDGEENDSEDERWWDDSGGEESDDGSDDESEDSQWGSSSGSDSEDGGWGDSDAESGSEADAENESDAGGEPPEEEAEDDSEDDRWWDDSEDNESKADEEPDEPGADDGAEGEEGNSHRPHRYVNLTDVVVVDMTDGSVADVTGLTAAEVANLTLKEDGDEVGVSVVNDTLVGERSEETAVGDGAGVELADDSLVDLRYGALATGNTAVTGLMWVPLSSVVAGLYTDVELGDGPTAVERDLDADAAVVAGAWQPIAAEERDDAAVAAGDSDDGAGDSGSDDGAGGAGAGAALFVLVGCFGGYRMLATQTVQFGGASPRNALASLRRAVVYGLGDVGIPFLPPVFGYSRQDDSDPLENDTRAKIYDLVMESPGIYYAQLAEETDVTEETVRYHSRVLADEGLVERRKIRGRKRLYPVSMDGENPEVAAAMADSAASDVISAIEHREPATLSAVADAIDCAPSTVSYHLDRLEEDGLISRERDGTAVRIKLRRPTRTALNGSVADD